MSVALLVYATKAARQHAPPDARCGGARAEHAWRLWTEHAVVYNALLSEGDAMNPAGTLIGSVLSFPCMPSEPGQGVTLYCLHKVMVDSAYRGHGIGAALMEACLHETDRLGADSFLTVNPTNQAAINLYISWGFEVTEQSLVRGYYEDAESGNRLVIVRPRGAKRTTAPRL